jgi:hypothetical protein
MKTREEIKAELQSLKPALRDGFQVETMGIFAHEKTAVVYLKLLNLVKMSEQKK